MKHRFNAFIRIIKTGIINFFRNAWLSVAATAVMVVAMSIILFGVVLNTTAKNAIKELSKNLKVSVYLKDGVKEEDRKRLQTAMSNNPNVATVDFISSDKAKSEFSENFSADDKLLQGLALVGGETLPASLEVSVTNLEKINEIGDIAKSKEYEPIVDSITLGKIDARKTIDRAISAQKFIVTASILAAALFISVSVLIIFNTIRMAIFTRNEEIKIMRLIGATRNFIRGPFIVEAAMYGVIAGIIANSAVYSAVFYIGSKLATQAEFTETYAYFIKPSTMFMLLGGAILAGVLIGVLSSFLAMSRYLRSQK